MAEALERNEIVCKTPIPDSDVLVEENRIVFRPDELKKYPIMTDHIDVPLGEEALRQIRITMAPTTDPAHLLILET
jgi:hypothetical protein